MKIFGQADANTIAQLQRCVEAEEGALGVLCADNHLGYSMPIGGVVAYHNYISPSGVGYDIACGNMAVKTPILAANVNEGEWRRIADEISTRISFGVGHHNDTPVAESPVFDRISTSPISWQRGMLQLAKGQLGTVGSGNHYVDVLIDDDGFVWVANHFGSRGFGWKTANGFLNLAVGREWEVRAHEDMNAPPTLIRLDSPMGQDYLEAMKIAGEYAYAGREEVIRTVLAILGVKATDSVHNHHNFAWAEPHGMVVRKGATPLYPDQRGFVGGSMGDIAVIVRGVDSPTAVEALHSVMHGAGRVMSRSRAKKGTYKWYCPVSDCPYPDWTSGQAIPKNGKCPEHGTQLIKEQLEPPINFRDVQDRLRANGTILIGAGADEAPGAYRPLQDVLNQHMGCMVVETRMRPKIVVMAGMNERDPYGD